MTLEEELNRVYCRVLYMPTVDRLIVNDKICEKLTKEAVKRVKSYGINCIEEEISPRGGGFETLWNIVRELWEMKDFIGIPLAIFRTTVMFVKYPFERHLTNSKPTLVIFLKIRKKSSQDDWHAPVEDKLVDLKFLAQDLSDWLKEQYPIYTFDQQFGLSLYPESYRVSVYQVSNKTSAYNNGRLIRRLRTLKPRNNANIDIRFSKFLFLKQTVSPVTCDGQGWMGENKYNNYFTIFSSRLIIQYPRLGPSRLRVLAGRVKNKLRRLTQQ